jgi:hypothetical protein
MQQVQTELLSRQRGDAPLDKSHAHPRAHEAGPRMILEQPLFRTVNGALSFAFNFKHGHLKPSALATMMAGARPKGKGLGGLDGAAQAGMIREQVDSLGLRGDILTARFAVRALPCPCRRPCSSGWRGNEEWLQAIAAISNHVRSVALKGTTVNFTLRLAIVRRYFGVRQSLADAAHASGVERHTASAHANKAITYLKAEEAQARYAIEAKLKASGVVE